MVFIVILRFCTVKRSENEYFTDLTWKRDVHCICVPNKSI